MNKKILVTVLSISLLHFSTNAMNNAASGFLSTVKNFILPYEVIGHTYKTHSHGHGQSCTPRYKLAQTNLSFVRDDAGNPFLVDDTGSPIKDKSGAFFVEKSAATKIKEKQDEYTAQTNALASSPDASLKTPRVFYRNYVGSPTMSFILNYPRTATSLKYAVLLGALYEGYSWFKSKKSCERVLIDADTEIEVSK